EKIMERAESNVGDVSVGEIDEVEGGGDVSIVATAKKAFLDLYEEHIESKEEQQKKVERITISSNWEEEGMTGIQILEAAKKKEIENQEKAEQKLEEERKK